MLLRIGSLFEIEVNAVSIWIQVGRFKRFYNRLGMPTH